MNTFRFSLLFASIGLQWFEIFTCLRTPLTSMRLKLFLNSLESFSFIKILSSVPLPPNNHSLLISSFMAQEPAQHNNLQSEDLFSFLPWFVDCHQYDITILSKVDCQLQEELFTLSCVTNEYFVHSRVAPTNVWPFSHTAHATVSQLSLGICSIYSIEWKQLTQQTTKKKTSRPRNATNEHSLLS